MLSSSTKPRVLCLSSAPSLLRTREMVLASRFDVVGVGNVEQLAALPGGESFAVIVLCHSLTPEECERAIKVARLRWPSAKIVALTSVASNFSPSSDHIVCSLDGPRVLLRTVEHLLAA